MASAEENVRFLTGVQTGTTPSCETFVVGLQTKIRRYSVARECRLHTELRCFGSSVH